MDTDVAARTLRLLILLQARTKWSAADLLKRTGTSARTLRRDLRRLIDLGYEVVSKPGPGGYYELVAGTRMPPMVFNDDEVLALITGLRMAEHTTSGDAASQALVKLRQVLPQRLATLTDVLATHSEALALDEIPNGDLIGSLTAAAAAGLSVGFSYTDQHGAASKRRVDSLRCLFVRGRWSALAFDLDRVDWRIFRLDRMSNVLVTDKPATRRDPPADDLAAWLRTDFGKTDGHPADGLRRRASTTRTRPSL